MTAARPWIVASCVLLALATLLGAFGSHALQAVVAPDRLAIWRTAVEYHFVQSLGLLGIGLLMLRWPESTGLRWPATLLLLGIALFCGGLYATVLGAPRGLNLIVPIGGLAFVAAWFGVAVVAWRRREM